MATGTNSVACFSGGATINGGTLTLGDTAGALVVDGNATFNGITISSSGYFQVADGYNATFVGTITNNGTIRPGSTSQILLSGNVTLSGSGKVDMFPKSIIEGASGLGTEILTNKNTIHGTGQLGNGLMGLVNLGKIIADQSGQLTINVGSKNFNNKGTLQVNTGDTLQITGPINSFLNFNSTTGTLTGGTYAVTGTLQFDNANILTNAANITLTGTSSQIINQSSANGLANFTTNASKGSFTLAGNRNLDSVGAFTNAGSMKISKGSTFTAHGGGNYTQTAGKTIVDGTLTTTASVSFASGNLLLSAPGIISIQGGTLFGTGNLAANVQSSGTITPADSSAKTAILTVTGAYTQNSTGALDIGIAGTTPGTKFDQLNITGAASLKGTLNISRLSAFVPATGNTFVILTANSVTGTFSTVNGVSINSSEHFAVVYNPTNVTLQVVSGPSACADGTAGQAFSASMTGCAGAVFFVNRASLGAAGWHVCTATEWVANKGLVVPTHNYWTADTLLVTSTSTGPGNCAVSTTSGSSCGVGSSMLVCSFTQPDPEGNTANWTGCGFNTNSPNEFFGGCPTPKNTAGALFCHN